MSIEKTEATGRKLRRSHIVLLVAVLVTVAWLLVTIIADYVVKRSPASAASKEA